MPQAYRNLIAGEWVECRSKQTFPNINPASTNEVIGDFQASAPEDVQAACAAAARSQPSWAASPAPRRGEYLFKAAELLQSRLDKAGLITINLPTAGVEYQLPFGGTKESSFGMRAQGPLALDFYTETRTVYLKYTQ